MSLEDLAGAGKEKPSTSSPQPSVHHLVLHLPPSVPLFLQGKAFCSSLASMGAALLGILYAVILKLSIFDLSPFEHASRSEALLLHAIPRSLWTSLAFIISFPLSILGIALTGVGFVAAVKQKDASIVRLLVCWGSFLCWATFTLTKALHRSLPLLLLSCAYVPFCPVILFNVTPPILFHRSLVASILSRLPIS